MQLYGHEINPYMYRDLKAEQLKDFRSMLKSNIRNLENIIESAIEEMIDEGKVEELLPLTECEVKTRKRN